MTQTARMYGGSLYELAVEEQLVEAIGGQMEEIRQIFHENADYMKLLSEPSVPWEVKMKSTHREVGAFFHVIILIFYSEFWYMFFII